MVALSLPTVGSTRVLSFGSTNITAAAPTAPEPPTPEPETHVDSVAALIAIGAPVDGQTVLVKGYSVPADGGGGTFVWVAGETDQQMATGADVSVMGAGYSEGDLIWLAGQGAGSKACFRATSVIDGAVAGVALVFEGQYSVLPEGDTTSETGSGCVLSVSWASHTDYGTRFPTAAGGAGRWVRLPDGSGRVSVKAFGAKGDAIADDWLAIQRAIWSWWPLYIPSGSYKVNKPLTWNGGRQLDILGAGKDRDSESKIFAGYASEEALLHTFGRHMKSDGSYAFETGYEISGTNLGGITDKLVLRNLKLQSDKSIWGTCCEISLSRNSYFERVEFRSTFRGLTLGQSTFDTVVMSCSTKGTFMGKFPWGGETNGEPNKVIARRAWGVYCNGHTFIYGLNAVGRGAGLLFTGMSNTIQGSRIEVCNYGVISGDKAYSLGQINGTLSTGSSFSATSIEACTIGVRVESLKESTMDNIRIQGSPADVANGRPEGEIGLHVIKRHNTSRIACGSANGHFSVAPIVNESSHDLERFAGNGVLV